MRPRSLDLTLLLLLVLINVGWTQVPASYQLMAVSIVLALPLVLFLPGYALTQALFRRKATSSEAAASDKSARPAIPKLGHPIGKADQIVLSLGLSMAIDVLVGFTLNLLPIGLMQLPWIFSLSLLTLLFAVLAIILRRKDTVQTTGAVKLRLTFLDCALFALAALIVASAVWFSIIRLANPQPSFTQFWMLPADQAHKTCTVSVGIQSFETTSTTFNVALTVNNAPANSWSAIVLEPQQKWTQLVTVTPGPTSSISVEARLYREGQPSTVYRDVHLTFDISSINANGIVQEQCVYGA